jgi:hypothetical protein
MRFEWVATSDVRIGDKIVCTLSDAEAFPTVTGWTDRVLHLGGRLGDVTQRTFTVTGAPWWVQSDPMQITGSIGDTQGVLHRMCIVKREPVITECVCGCLDPLPRTCPDCHEPLTEAGTHRYSDHPLVQIRAAGLLRLN